MAKTVNNVKINTTFTTAKTREQLTSGENLCTSLGKINKYLVDLDAGTFSRGENILRNANFVINQRGKTKYSIADDGGVDEYTVDCWKLVTNKLGSKKEVLEVRDTGIALYTTASSTSDWAEICQYIEGAKQYAGKKLTLSVYATNASDAFITTYGADASAAESNKISLNDGISTLTLTIPEDTRNIQISIRTDATSASNPALINWVKLEEGSIATPYTIPDPAIELIRCQRYLQAINANTAIRASGLATNFIDFCIPLVVPMVSKPRIVDSSPMQVCKTNFSVVADFTFTVTVRSSSSINIRATKNAHGLSDALFRVTSQVFLSAEL